MTSKTLGRVGVSPMATPVDASRTQPHITGKSRGPSLAPSTTLVPHSCGDRASHRFEPTRDFCTQFEIASSTPTPGFTHHNSDTGSYGKFRIPSKPRLLPYSFATFR